MKKGLIIFKLSDLLKGNFEFYYRTNEGIRVYIKKPFGFSYKGQHFWYRYIDEKVLMAETGQVCLSAFIHKVIKETLHQVGSLWCPLIPKINPI